MDKKYARAKIETPIYSIDFEGAKSCGIVEFGIVEIIDWQISNVDTAICLPKNKIPKETIALCNFKESDFDNSKKKFEEYSQLFVSKRKNGIFLAHNKTTEDSLLRSYWPNPSLFTDFANNSTVCTWAPWIDTLRIVKKIFPKLKSYSLSDLIANFALQEKLDLDAKKFCPKNRNSWHCAAYDAIANAELLIMIASLEGFENLSLKWLTLFSQQYQQESLF